MFISYSVGWARTEEHFAMELTASVAARLPPKVRDLVGFEMHGSLGFFDNTIHDAHTDEGTSAMMREDGTVREGAAPELDGVLGKLAAGEIGVAEAKDRLARL